MNNAANGTAARIAIRAENVWKSYDEGAITVLKGVDFEAHAGQAVALCGPSGCGKSTLLQLVGGLDEPDRGRVVVNGVELNRRRDMVQFLQVAKLASCFNCTTSFPISRSKRIAFFPPRPPASTGGPHASA